LIAISRNRATDPRRPIIFIAYSLGGLLLKAALHQALNTPKFTLLLNSTYGVLLFGTPRYTGPLSNHILRSLIRDVRQKLLIANKHTKFRPLIHSESHTNHTRKSQDLYHNLQDVPRQSCAHISVCLFYSDIGLVSILPTNCVSLITNR